MEGFRSTLLLLLAALVLALASAARTSPSKPLQPSGLTEADINEEDVQ